MPVPVPEMRNGEDGCADKAMPLAPERLEVDKIALALRLAVVLLGLDLLKLPLVSL